ncbi:MAG: GGDEF domain-containing protein [Gammaproteobacteria bacterium]|nr:GGDEF domain-containing protein [Gammaproteobacteria bacterium]
MIGIRLIDRVGTVIGRLGHRQATLATAALTALVAAFDYATGVEVSFSLFYLLPVALMTWASGPHPGMIAVAVCMVVWFMIDKAGGQTYSNAAIPYWNALIRGGFFAVVCLMLWRLRVAVGRERDLARTDGLTGAWNRRFFTELLDLENRRFTRERRPFTLVYIDLDNFKQVNDREGHGAGDALLRTVVADLRAQLRRTDLVARIGGDEFALLLPETGPEVAGPLVIKLHEALNAAMIGRGSPVRFSLGALTCHGEAPSADVLLGAADALMYRAKHGGKDRLVTGFWPEREAPYGPGEAAPG